MSSSDDVSSNASFDEVVYELSDIVKAGLFITALTIMMLPIYFVIKYMDLGSTTLYISTSIYLLLIALIIYRFIDRSIGVLDFSKVIPLDPSIVLKIGLFSLIGLAILSLLMGFNTLALNIYNLLTNILITIFIVSLLYLLLALYLSIRTLTLLVSIALSVLTIYLLFQVPLPHKFLLLLIPAMLLSIGVHSCIVKVQKMTMEEAGETIVKPEYATLSGIKKTILRNTRLAFIKLRRAFLYFLLTFLFIIITFSVAWFIVFGEEFNPTSNSSPSGFIEELTTRLASGNLLILSIALLTYLFYLLGLFGNLIPGASILADYDEDLRMNAKMIMLFGLISVLLGATSFTISIILEAAIVSGRLTGIPSDFLTLLYSGLAILRLVTWILSGVLLMFIGSFLSKVGAKYGSGALSAAGTLSILAVVFGLIAPIALVLISMIIDLLNIGFLTVIVSWLPMIFSMLLIIAAISVLVIPIAWGLAYKGCDEIVRYIDSQL